MPWEEQQVSVRSVGGFWSSTEWLGKERETGVLCGVVALEGATQ